MKFLPGLIVLFILFAERETQAAPDYLTAVKPLFASRCFDCHGALKQKAKLRVDTAAAMIAAEVVIPGKPDESLLIELISTPDVDERMPPEHEGVPFTKAEVGVIRQWIAAGAKAPPDEKPEADPEDHWSFQPVVRPKVPAVKNSGWVRNPIDSFVGRKHEVNAIEPQPEASPTRIDPAPLHRFDRSPSRSGRTGQTRERDIGKLVHRLG